MRLMDLREFSETYYSDRSRPSFDRLRRLAAAGDIRGAQLQGKRWFVDVDQFENGEVDGMVKRILQAPPPAQSKSKTRSKSRRFR
jgi:hypothetical protein